MMFVPLLIAISGLCVPACALARSQRPATVTVTANKTFTEYACVSNNLPPVTVTQCPSVNLTKVLPYTNTTHGTISTAPISILPFTITTTETVTSVPTGTPACNFTTTETVTAVVLTNCTSSASQPTTLETSGQPSTKPVAVTSTPTPRSASSAIPTPSARDPSTPLNIAHCKASWEAFKAKVAEYEDKAPSNQPHLNTLNEWEEVGARAESRRITNEVCSEHEYHALSGAGQKPIEYAS